MRATSKLLPTTLALLVPRDVFGALTALGIDAEERGNEAVALCPNPDHDDRHASWSCNLDTGEHHCFACGFGGSFMLLVGKMLGKTRGDAETWVRDRKLKDIAAGVIIDRPRQQARAIEVSEADMWKFTEPARRRPGRARAHRSKHARSTEYAGTMTHSYGSPPSATPAPASSGDGRQRTPGPSTTTRATWLSPRPCSASSWSLTAARLFWSSLRSMLLTRALHAYISASILSLAMVPPSAPSRSEFSVVDADGSSWPWTMTRLGGRAWPSSPGLSAQLAWMSLTTATQRMSLLGLSTS